MMVYGVLADLIVIFHLGYVGFTLGGELLILLGGALKWQWIRKPLFRIVHLAAMGVVALEALGGVLCPLTEWEYNLRVLAGQRVERNISFVGRLVRSVIFYDFPSWVFTLVYILFTLLIIFTFILIPPRFKKKPGRNAPG